MDKKSLHVQRVCFRYEEPDVLKNVSFSIQPGSFVSLVGPNGSGKSTLFHISCGDWRASSGEVCYGGENVFHMKARARSQLFSVLQQGEKQDFPFTVLEMVLFGLHPHRSLFADFTEPQLSGVYATMEEVGILPLADALITQVSGGEFQRVMLARAIVQQPSVLFLDEAMNELDICVKIELTQCLKAMTREKGLIVFAVNHDLPAAARHSDRIIALKDGQIAADGTPEEVFTESFFQTVFGVKAQIFPDGEFLIHDKL